jgi:hypothetical protein
LTGVVAFMTRIVTMNESPLLSYPTNRSERRVSLA